MAHRNAKLNCNGRLLLLERVASGWTQSQAADAGGISRATASKWVKRFREEGIAGLEDRSSRPQHSPRALASDVVDAICQLRRELGAGPHRLSYELGIPASTIYVVLKRAGLSVLAWLDRTTREPIRRYERPYPGALVHLDIKRLGRVPDGGGKRFDPGFFENWSGRARPGKPGHDHIHVAVDDHSRFAYAEALLDQRGETAAGFLGRAVAAFAAEGFLVERVLTDNGRCYLSRAFLGVASDLDISLRRTRPYRPQTNGKAEAFNKTLQREWAYRRQYTSNTQRTEALQTFLNEYNYRRPHTAIGNRPPVSRLVNNLSENYS